ncbi:MAG: hypothetical protein AABM67_17310 [Acidobacteriota bacterium]
MPWYLIELTPADIQAGKDRDLEQSAQAIWDSSGNPVDFALFGTHKIGSPDSPSILYYLSPEGHKYCTDGTLMGWRPRVLHEHEKPLREGLRVIVGDPGALQLLASNIMKL